MPKTIIPLGSTNAEAIQSLTDRLDACIVFMDVLGRYIQDSWDKGPEELRRRTAELELSMRPRYPEV